MVLETDSALIGTGATEAEGTMNEFLVLKIPACDFDIADISIRSRHWKLQEASNMIQLRARRHKINLAIEIFSNTIDFYLGYFLAAGR